MRLASIFSRCCIFFRFDPLLGVVNIFPKPGEHFRKLFDLKKILAALLLCTLAGSAWGGEIVFKPINPSFGGNPFNDGHLLATANIQNKYTAKREERDLSEQFVRSLQSRLYSSLATQVQEAIFGDDPQESGTFLVGEQQVSFVRGLEVITLEISNLADGTTTVIEVPVLSVE